MTNTRDDIAAIGWTLGETARRLGVPESTVRSWLRRDSCPSCVAGWLRRIARLVVQEPPPQR